MMYDLNQLFSLRALLEITLLSFIIYSMISFLHGSKGAGILRGLGAVLAILFAIVLTLSQWLDLYVLNWLINNVAIYLVIALIVIFQPELRSALVRVGQSPMFTRFIKEHWDASEQITIAVMKMSSVRTGALIALQRSVGLKTYTEGGVRLDAQVSAELLLSIFEKGSPLHDGAVVIKGDRVIAAACLFPLSENPNIDTILGTRHRAGIGVTEESDAIAVIVSEETGDISVAQNGALIRKVDSDTLKKILHTVSTEGVFQTAPVEELT